MIASTHDHSGVQFCAGASQELLSEEVCALCVIVYFAGV